MYFYEIHEGDEELGTAVIVGHERRFDPVEFFALVKKARALLVESYQEDSLAEAIANALERSSGFVHISDDRLVASVNVDESEEQTFLVRDEGGTRSVYGLARTRPDARRPDEDERRPEERTDYVRREGDGSGDRRN